MSSIKPHLDRLTPALRRAASHVRGGHVVAISAVAIAAFGLAGLRSVDLPQPRPITDSERLRIEVVPPVEPAITPGAVMEVGELVDGFQGVPRPAPRMMDVLWSGDDGDDWRDDGWREDDRAWAAPRSDARRLVDERTLGPGPDAERPAPVRAVRRWFGFDEPRRDYQAERAARRARMDEIERDRRADERFRREQADRYEFDRRRAEARDAPPWRDDRRRPPPPGRYDRDDDRPSRDGWDDRGPPPEQAPRPYYADDRGPPPDRDGWRR